MKQLEVERNESPLAVIQKEKYAHGIEWWRNKRNGFKIIDLSYWADPAKDNAEWVAQSQAGIPRAEWNREFGSTWVVYDGKPVYQDYDATAHRLSGKIVVPRRTRLISGWDGGPNDVNLAWVLGLVVPHENAVLFIDEYATDDGNIPEFVEIVATKLQLEWVKLGGFSIHVADQSVFTGTQLERGSGTRGGKAMADVMRQHGMAPIPGEISFAKRRSNVERLLKGLYKSVDGVLVPKWRLHERCELLHEAMQGGYAYGKSVGGVGGEYKPVPVKNKFSHIANAMEYACSRLGMLDMQIPFEGRMLPSMSLV